MKRHFFLTWSVLLLLFYSSYSQEYSYTRYDVKDGLAGSNVYCITQDKQGFLWMGTDGGVSRFDGTHFRNFTLEDGLPDIEVLQIFADSKGRVWMSPFSKTVCFYLQDRIHNQDNDPLLEKVHITGNIENFAEDRDGNIMMQEKNVLHIVTSDGKIKDITRIDSTPLISCVITTDTTGHFLIQDKGDLYQWANGHFTHVLSFDYIFSFTLFIAMNARLLAYKESAFRYIFKSMQTGMTASFYFEAYDIRHVSFSAIGDSLFYRNETSGSTEYNMFTGVSRHFETGGKISRTFRDNEGNIWFTSLGQGIFRVNSAEIRNIPLLTKDSFRCVVHTIKRAGKELLIGTSNNMLFKLALPSLKDAGSRQAAPGKIDEVYYVDSLKDGNLLMGSSTILIRPRVDRPYQMSSFGVMFPVKSAVLKNDSELLAGGHDGVALIDIKDFRVKDMLWRDRATVVYYKDGIVYIGTINGLYTIKEDKVVEYWGSRDPLLSKRISSIVQSPDGRLWIATYGEGIIAYKKGLRVATLTRRQGLSSDLCRVLELHDNILWVGTDKGLNKVDISNPEFPVTVYTSNDGLGSDIINAICTDSSMVYVGTPAGITFFKAGLVDRSAACRLVLLGVTSSGKDRLRDTATLGLPYNGNNIRFEFVGISYKSAGDISYHYRLMGLDASWKSTKESFLEYPTLPSGDYEMQLRAINKFGVESQLVTIRFTVAKPFWKTLWFDTLVLLLFLASTWLFISLRIKHLRRRQAEQVEVNKRLAETEHMALQSQMNPHFIFNCLNSIQQYIFDQDIFAANKYITGFAKLIRATLHNSSKPFISLSEEIGYLSAYLSLEKLRFKEKMNYSIEIEPPLQAELEDIHIPPMLIQPYVENCMRHGLRHKTEGKGFIRIKIMQEGNMLAIIIEDNGIGRKQAARYKTREHIEYQSKGMSLTADRIRLINTVSGETIRVEVMDLTNEHGEATGTRVIVRFPRFDLFFQSNNL